MHKSAAGPAGLLLLGLVACKTDNGDSGASDPVDGPIDPCPTDGLCTLSGLDSSLETDDLVPLGQIIGDARVVGLGEAVHRSGGFLQMKGNRVMDLGFNALLF